MVLAIKCPDRWRKGQTLFNFMHWVKENYEKDIFYMEDKEVDRLYKKFLKEFSK